MKLVYIAGAYRGKNENEVYENIQKARNYAAMIWRAGFVAVCPHMNTAFMGGVVDDKTFLDGDLKILSRCDYIFMIPGWEKSEGAKSEALFAHQNNIPIWNEVILSLKEGRS